MNIFGLTISRRPSLKSHNHDFNDADREAARKVREAQMDLKLKEIELHMAELQADIDEVTGSNNPTNYEDMLAQYFLPMIQKKLTQPQQPVVQQPTQTDLTDEQIKEIIAGFPPKQVKMFQKMSKEVQYNLIKANMPQLSEKTINRAIELLQ